MTRVRPPAGWARHSTPRMARWVGFIAGKGKQWRTPPKKSQTSHTNLLPPKHRKQPPPPTSSRGLLTRAVCPDRAVQRTRNALCSFWRFFLLLFSLFFFTNHKPRYTAGPAYPHAWRKRGDPRMGGRAQEDVQGREPDVGCPTLSGVPRAVPWYASPCRLPVCPSPRLPVSPSARPPSATLRATLVSSHPRAC